MPISKEMLERFERAIQSYLTERERKVLWLHYGLDDGEPRSFQEIGSLLGVDAATARQIRNHAVHSIRGVPDVEATGVLAELKTGSNVPNRVDLVPLGILIESGDSSAQDIADLYVALSDLYRAYGGSGLMFRSSTDVRFVSGAL